MPGPKIPTSFTRKKEKIFAKLSVPENEYLDKSPKGSVDEGIRDLIDEINAYEGLVTTSSCAGRISVFLEGEKAHGQLDDVATGNGTSGRTATGGKGGGSFLFTSHEPLDLSSLPNSLTETFKLKLVPPKELGSAHFRPLNRMVRFSFEPMILHVMAASLKHARPLLSAAINAGFRESGVQSLHNLDHPEACPMVAVRTAGLGVESIIGQAGAHNELKFEHQRAEGDELYASEYEALVTEEYLGILVGIANERFEANKHKISRFGICLREAMTVQLKKEHVAEAWEDIETRRKRKREEGLRASHDKKSFHNSQTVNAVVDEVSNIQELFERQNLLQRHVLNGGSTSKDFGI
jgi:tRNA wybutosine-synthesizing protein 3